MGAYSRRRKSLADVECVRREQLGAVTVSRQVAGRSEDRGVERASAA